MTTFSGVATVNQDRVPVTVGLEEEKISLHGGAGPIAEWRVDECHVVEVGAGTFLISAANDSISFQPDDPGSFARGLGLWSRPVAKHAAAPERDDPVEPGEAPPPERATLIGFYALVGLTAVLLVWAVISLLS